MGFLNTSFAVGHSGTWYTWWIDSQHSEHPYYFWQRTLKKKFNSDIDEQKLYLQEVTV